MQQALYTINEEQTIDPDLPAMQASYLLHFAAIGSMIKLGGAVLT